MEPALVFTIGVLVCFLVITGLSLYTAFGPPSKGLTDPFEEHED